MAKPEKAENVTPLRSLKCSEVELKRMRAAAYAVAEASHNVRRAQVAQETANVNLESIIKSILEEHNAPSSWGIDDAIGTIGPRPAPQRQS